MTLIYRERDGGAMIPWWGGIAWVEDFGHCKVYSYLGLNLILRWLRMLRWLVGGYPKYELYSTGEIAALENDAYNSGFIAGVKKKPIDRVPMTRVNYSDILTQTYGGA